ncbi:MAG: GNAT family N-acetyltransferase, partial [Dehalococcoidia bacterium]|nr:GNAT family N-acetyltransferase [Dehalococcoidia bacterium]
MGELPRVPTLEEYEVDVPLRDGSTVHLRPIRPDDDGMMIALFNRFSPRTIYLRFHHVIGEMTKEEVQRYTRIDYQDTFALVATLGEPPDERIIAVGRYARLGNSDRAEVAFVVEDSHQRRGISTHLLDQLAIVARGKDIRIFETDVLGENKEMMEVFRESGFHIESQLEDGIFHVVFAIEATPALEEKADYRDQMAATASIRAFFHPNSVAVIGASRKRLTIGGELFHNILHDGFKGVVYPINPQSPVVGAVRAYPSILDVLDDVDLAIVAVPAAQVVDVASQCARKGVRAMVVISAGFGETGGEGLAREKALLAKIRSYGMRLIGPNCMGILNTDPEVSLNATFSPVFPPRGNVGLLSQSGALGLALLDYSRDLNIGLSTFVSVGNKADVSANDLIQYWEQDPSTDVILLYLESFGNPRRFARVARRVTATKPIIAVKSGRTAAGSRAASSHTGALAGLDVASDALFRQAGVIRVDTLEQLFDVANLLAHQPIPKGKRVAIVTNGGGPAILAADACESYGLDVPHLSEATLRALRDFLPAAAGLSNPIDLLASASGDDYARALRILLQDDGVDSVIVIYIPHPVTKPEEAAAAIRDVAKDFWGQKPLLACFMSARGAPPELALDKDRAIPSFAFPEAAAMALAKTYEYAEWRKRPAGTIPKLPDVRPEEGHQIV